MNKKNAVDSYSWISTALTQPKKSTNKLCFFSWMSMALPTNNSKNDFGITLMINYEFMGSLHLTPSKSVLPRGTDLERTDLDNFSIYVVFPFFSSLLRALGLLFQVSPQRGGCGQSVVMFMGLSFTFGTDSKAIGMLFWQMAWAPWWDLTLEFILHSLAGTHWNPKSIATPIKPKKDKKKKIQKIYFTLFLNSSIIINMHDNIFPGSGKRRSAAFFAKCHQR